MKSWMFVTDVGDAAITITLALVVLVCFIVAGNRRAVLAWVGAVGLCGISIAVMKVLLRGCVGPVLDGSVVSPSGHAAASATVFGGIAAILAARLPRRARFVPVLLAAGLAGGITASRVVLHMHSPMEAVVGLAVGTVCALLFAIFAGKTPLGRGGVAALFALSVAAVAVLHGFRLPIERFLVIAAEWMRTGVNACG